ncbi:MAG: hypothetical protein ACR2NR_02940 [Solirubrobacteraceae bacterium]
MGLAGLAWAQRGPVHRRQLTACGVSRGSIAHRVRNGALHRLYPSVYVLGHDALPERAVEVAALLYAGDDSVLSHHTAAALWGSSNRNSTLCRSPSCDAISAFHPAWLPTG